jgi:hypothetical protein
MGITGYQTPKKDNCDLCKIKTNKRKAIENPFLDNLFKDLYRQKFDFIID